MIRDNQINPRRNLTRSDVPPISKHERRKTQPRERERERERERSIPNTNHGSRMLQKYKNGRETNPPQKTKSPETKMQERGKEGQDGWGQPKRKCNIRLEREREKEIPVSLKISIEFTHSLTHSLTYLSFFLKLRLIDSTDHQQNSKSGETKKHHRPQNCLSVCLSVCRWRREREEEEEKEKGRWLKLRPDRSARVLYVGGPTNKNPRKPF